MTVKAVRQRMFSISRISGLFNTALGALLVGSPGIVIGGLIGAFAWRSHRVWGAALGAILGFLLCLYGWLYFGDVVMK
jgi:ABC-type antimicrobial peptide transport system permease subunit